MKDASMLKKRMLKKSSQTKLPYNHKGGTTKTKSNQQRVKEKNDLQVQKFWSCDKLW